VKDLAEKTDRPFCTACFTGEYPVLVHEDRMYVNKYARKLSEKNT